MTHTGVTSRIRSILGQFKAPMTISQILDELPSVVERNNLNALLIQRKRAGEFSVELIDGKPHYAIVPGFTKACSQRTPKGAQSHSSSAPKRARTETAAGPTPVTTLSPAPPHTPVATTPPLIAHAAALEIPSAARSEHRANAAVILLRALADLIEGAA